MLVTPVSHGCQQLVSHGQPHQPCQPWLSRMLVNNVGQPCQSWLLTIVDTMVVNHACPQYLSTMVVNNSYQQWLSTMVALALGVDVSMELSYGQGATANGPQPRTAT